jgi:hypothetical protein
MFYICAYRQGFISRLKCNLKAFAMIKKQYVMQLAVILSVAAFYFRVVTRWIKTQAGWNLIVYQLTKQNICLPTRPNRLVTWLFKYTYPVKATDNRLKDSLNLFRSRMFWR